MGAMNILCIVCAGHGHPVPVKIGNKTRGCHKVAPLGKVPYGQVAEAH